MFAYLTYQYAALFEKKYREKKIQEEEKIHALERSTQEYRRRYEELSESHEEIKARYNLLQISERESAKEKSQLKEELEEVRQKLSRKKVNHNMSMGKYEQNENSMEKNMQL